MYNRTKINTLSVRVVICLPLTAGLLAQQINKRDWIIIIIIIINHVKNLI